MWRLTAMLDEYVAGRLGNLVSRGLVADWRVRPSHTDDMYFVDVVLSNHSTLRYNLTATELHLDGADAMRRVVDLIEEAAWNARPDRPPTAPRYREGAYPDGLDNFLRHFESWQSPKSDEADTKARNLFITMAGQRAYDKLAAQQPLLVVGSAGRRYFLHCRATYCVTRESDGAKLCAVVPGVPLWDHLLGIKLMIEHDEPRFLRTANVSGGGPLRNFEAAIGPGMQQVWGRIWSGT